MMKRFIFIVILILSSFLIYTLRQKNDDKHNTTDSELIKLGYSKENVAFINAELSIDNINYLLTLPYNEAYIKMMKNENFNKEKLNSYINYYDEYRCPEDEAVTLVNLEIDKEYDTKLVSLVNEKYYKTNNLDRYYNYLINYPNLSVANIISYINSNLDYDYYTTNYPSDLDKANLILVNKYYRLGNDYEPNNLVHVTNNYGGDGQYIQNIALENYKKMYDDIKKEGLNLVIKSSYRSYSYQNGLYNNYVNRDGKEKADTYSARPGYSEHQTGLAIDVGTPSTIDLGEFEGTPEFNWMIKNAYKYGFILRYPEDKVNITGYMYEPWHFRYVGIEAAKYIKENDITFEEYYEYYLK